MSMPRMGSPPLLQARLSDARSSPSLRLRFQTTVKRPVDASRWRKGRRCRRKDRHHHRVEGVKTVGKAVGGFVEGGSDGAQREWNQGKAETKHIAHQGADEVKQESKDCP